MDTDQLLPLLANYYPLTGVQICKRLPTKGTRQVYVLTTDQGRFILKVTDQTRSENQVQTELSTLDLLDCFDFPAPRLLTTREGCVYVPFRGSFVYLYHYIEGVEPRPSLEFFVQLGYLLAQLHNIPVHAEVPRSRWRPEEIVRELIDVLQKVETTEEKKIVANIRATLEGFPSMEGLPESLVHSDPWYSNLLEDKLGQLYLVDWDDSGVSYPILDVGYVMTYLCVFLPAEQIKWQIGDGQGLLWKEEWWSTFLKAYQSIRPLSSAELDLLPASIRLNTLAYLPDWGSKHLVMENYQRWKLLEFILAAQFNFHLSSS